MREEIEKQLLAQLNDLLAEEGETLDFTERHNHGRTYNVENDGCIVVTLVYLVKGYYHWRMIGKQDENDKTLALCRVNFWDYYGFEDTNIYYTPLGKYTSFRQVYEQFEKYGEADEEAVDLICRIEEAVKGTDKAKDFFGEYNSKEDEYNYYSHVNNRVMLKLTVSVYDDPKVKWYLPEPTYIKKWIFEHAKTESAEKAKTRFCRAEEDALYECLKAIKE